VALHLVSYGYDRDADAVGVLHDVTVCVRLDRPRRRGFVVAPGAGRREVDVRHEGDAHVVALGDVGVYAVLVLCDGSPDA
jgi:hypothetical protein